MVIIVYLIEFSFFLYKMYNLKVYNIYKKYFTTTNNNNNIQK